MLVAAVAAALAALGYVLSSTSTISFVCARCKGRRPYLSIAFAPSGCAASSALPSSAPTSKSASDSASPTTTSCSSGSLTAAYALGELLADQLAFALASSTLEEVEALGPVPLHARRLRHRGFNQAQSPLFAVAQVREMSMCCAGSEGATLPAAPGVV